MDINIRFTITQKDGKLEKMMSKVPTNIRTEVVKEALRFYFKAVRDRDLESDFIDADILDSFQANISKKMDIEDLKCILSPKTVAVTPNDTLATSSNQKNQYTQPDSSEDIYNTENNNYNDDIDNEEEKSLSSTYINTDLDDDF